VGLLTRRQAYDRTRILEAADRAAARKRWRRAIRLYRRVLAVEPGNIDLCASLAPLLARAGQGFDAWTCFRRAARSLAREGDVERALVTYREATRLLPHELQAWLALADLERRSDRERDAMQTLLKARHRMRGRRLRPQAIYLLRRVREIDPWRFEAVLGLARLLARADQADEAAVLLERLASRCEGSRLRRVRAAQLRLAPTLRHAWLWLRAPRGVRHPASGAPERT
jgi:tetratricopeptide (TPR) repeat protein